MEKSFYSKYKLRQVINASGRMSILGVSTLSDTVIEAMNIGARNYFEMADLNEKAKKYIADEMQSEDALIVNSASSGIALSVAGMVTKGNLRLSEKLHEVNIPQNEIILFKGHNVQYGAPIETMIRLGGGQPVEVGYANEGRAEHIISAISKETAAILFVQSHHAVQKNMISLTEAWQVAKEHQIPLIVDAAAEGNFKKYIKQSDLAIFSGSKALEGPTSGIVAGKSKYIAWVKQQQSFIGRSMKVGKEAIFGLIQAIAEYDPLKTDHVAEAKKLAPFLTLNDLKGIKASLVNDGAGRDIKRAKILIEENMLEINAEEMTRQLKEGDTAVYTRDYGVRQGFFELDVRAIEVTDAQFIVEKIKSIIGG